MENIYTNLPTSIVQGGRKAYQLMFFDHRGNAAKIVHFDSDDGHEAFAFAERETAGRTGELWLDDELVCGLVRDEDNVWSIRRAQVSQDI